MTLFFNLLIVLFRNGSDAVTKISIDVYVAPFAELILIGEHVDVMFERSGWNMWRKKLYIKFDYEIKFW